MKINFPRRSPFFVLSSLFYLFFVRLSISEQSLDYNFIILGHIYCDDAKEEICKEMIAAVNNLR